VAGATPDAVHDELAAAGLSVSTLQAWLASGAPLSREEFRGAVQDGDEFYFVAHP
jgi:hypothetical protein